eukprot:m.1398932 g.1398932  ORF g.1398932 m.1398932 type:complete len:93 (-) comp24999_c0_seq46:4583-4861(-)
MWSSLVRGLSLCGATRAISCLLFQRVHLHRSPRLAQQQGVNAAQFLFFDGVLGDIFFLREWHQRIHTHGKIHIFQCFWQASASEMRQPFALG